MTRAMAVVRETKLDTHNRKRGVQRMKFAQITEFETSQIDVRQSGQDETGRQLDGPALQRCGLCGEHDLQHMPGMVRAS